MKLGGSTHYRERKLAVEDSRELGGVMRLEYAQDEISWRKTGVIGSREERPSS